MNGVKIRLLAGAAVIALAAATVQTLDVAPSQANRGEYDRPTAAQVISRGTVEAPNEALALVQANEDVARAVLARAAQHRQHLQSLARRPAAASGFALLDAIANVPVVGVETQPVAVSDVDSGLALDDLAAPGTGTEVGTGLEPKPTAAATRAIAFATDQLGDAYRYGATGPDAWDCSGLVGGAWKAGGKTLPRRSVDQYLASTPVSANALRPGDLVFWANDPKKASTIFHVALYVGNGQIIHAPRAGRPVTQESIAYWRPADFHGRI